MPSRRRRSRSAGSASFDAADGWQPAAELRDFDGKRLAELAADELAGESEFVRLRSLARAAAERRHAALAFQADTAAASTQKLVERRLRGDRRLSRRALRGDRRVQRALDVAAAELSTLRVSAAYETEHGAAGQEPWRSVLLLSALPLFSFYGRRHVNHHLTLLGLLMIFLLGERLTDLLSGTDEHREYAKWWSYLAPAVNLLAGWWLLHDRQLERVVSGVADDFELVRRQRGEPRELRGARGAFSFAGLELEGTIRLRSEEAHDATSVVERYVTLVDLAPHVAADLALELPAISGLAAAATLVELEWSVPDTAHPRIVALAATVVDGKLELIVTARADARARGRRRRLLRTLRVAWLVDLDIPRTPADRSLL